MLCRYWRKSPPAHIALATFLGIGGSRSQPNESDYAELFRLFGKPAPE